jgi:hypothetical protein
VTLSEREQAHNFLKQTHDSVCKAITGLSESQWNFSPSADSWSVGGIAEHIVIVCDLVRGPIRAQITQAPPPPAGRDYAKVDAIIIDQFPQRNDKFPSPPITHPTGRFTSPNSAMEALAESYKGLAEYLETTHDLRNHFLDAPPLRAATKGEFNSMDGYQWILAASAHAERHARQIMEVKEDAKFPTN